MTFMKTILFSLGLALLLSLPSEAHPITASNGACDGPLPLCSYTVHGISSDRGYMMFVLYRDKQGLSHQGKENLQATLRCEPGNRRSSA